MLLSCLVTPPARRRSGIRVVDNKEICHYQRNLPFIVTNDTSLQRETQRTVLSTLPEQQELSKSQEGLNQFPITESISFSTSPPFLNEPQTSAQNSTENNKQQQEEEEKQKQRSLSSPETPSPLPNITHTSTNIRHSSSSPPPPSFSNQSSNQVNVQTTTTTTTVPSTRRLQSSVRLSYRKSVDVLKSSSKIYTALFSSSSSSSSSSSNNSSNVDDDDRWDIDTPPLGFDNFKLRRTLSDLLEVTLKPPLSTSLHLFHIHFNWSDLCSSSYLVTKKWTLFLPSVNLLTKVQTSRSHFFSSTQSVKYWQFIDSVLFVFLWWIDW